MLYAKNTIEFDGNDSVVGECEFVINDQLFLETLMMMIRGEAISYASFLKKTSYKQRTRIRKKNWGFRKKINNSRW